MQMLVFILLNLFENYLLLIYNNSNMNTVQKLIDKKKYIQKTHTNYKKIIEVLDYLISLEQQSYLLNLQDKFSGPTVANLYLLIN